MNDEAAKSIADQPRDTLSTAQRTLLIKSASYASLSVALSLVLLKAWGWQETASVSLLSSLADSVLDVFASAITFWAVRYSLSPADADHRFGHGKSEGLAALFQAVIIASSGLYVCYEAISPIFSPRDIAAPEIGLGVIIIATAATVMLVWFQRYVGRKTGSVAIKADAMHYQTDLMINLGVGLAIILTSWTGFTIIDPLVGMLIAIVVLNSVFSIMNRSLEILLDHEIPLEDRQAIEAIALAHPDVRGFHDMRTRFGGNHYIVQFHLELEADITLRRTHDILDDVESLLIQRYPECEILIHADPLGLHEVRDGFDQVDLHLPCLLALSAVILGACAKNIVIETDFPEPVVPPLPLNIGVHFDTAFTQYTYTEDLPNDIEWSFDLGAANRKLFDGIFTALFDITSPVDGNGGPEPAYASLDAVITPTIEAFEFSLPRQSQSEQYSVWIRYNLFIYSPDGSLITKYPVSAYGQSDTRTFGASAAMEEAVIKAMRDAAASIVMGFAEQQKIKETLLSDEDSP